MFPLRPVLKRCRPWLALLLLAAAGPASSLPTHSGTIGSDETWAGAGEVHLLTGDVTISDGVRVTIDPGAIVRFQARYTL